MSGANASIPWSPPAEFDGYRLRGLLGHGGMGAVYLGHDTLLDRSVAIKFVRGAHDNAQAMFLNEARAAARLQHPNVVSVYRVGQLEGQHYIVSEYVRGQPLDRLPRPMSGQRALAVALALTRGLAAAHRRGILHRDIKLANAIQSADGEIKLLDFGLAKLSSEAEDQVPAEGQVPSLLQANATAEPAFSSSDLSATTDLSSAEPGSKQAVAVPAVVSVRPPPFTAPQAQATSSSDTLSRASSIKGTAV